jgi:hypothetical protein
MITELIIQVLIAYKAFLMANFPYMIIALAIVNDGNIKNFLWALSVTTIVLQFVPSMDAIKEAQAINRLDEVKSSKDVREICKANAITIKRKPRKLYAEN